MDLQNMTNEELNSLLEQLVELKTEKTKAHRAEVLAELKARTTYQLVDKPVLATRALRKSRASAKREREQARKARVAEMKRREAERALERERKAEEKAAQKAAKAAAKADAKASEQADQGASEHPM